MSVFNKGVGISISKRAGKAIGDYKMLSDGDRVVVGLSGGKDSLTLLTLLHYRRGFAPIKYDLVAVHVDTGVSVRHLNFLRKYAKELGVPLHIVDQRLLFKGEKKERNCFWCSWNRRKALFETAGKLGCNKVALGHHKDDLVETTLLNLFFHGEISSISPYQRLFGGKLVIIRPLVYVEEDLIRRFAQEAGFAAFTCRCPYGNFSQRMQMKRIIRQIEKVCPAVKTNIFRSLQRIKKDYLP